MLVGVAIAPSEAAQLQTARPGELRGGTRIEVGTDAVLTVARRLSAATSVSVATEGALQVGRPLSGSTTVAVTTTGALTVETPFELTTTADGEIELDGATGVVTVTVTSPSWYANYDAGNGPGVFTFDSADLANGPVNLVPPKVAVLNDADASGTLTVGDTVGIADPPNDDSYPGLWVYDPANGTPTVTYQWQQDNQGDGNFTDLAGETGTTLVA